MNYKFDFIKKIDRMSISVDNKIKSIVTEIEKFEKESNTLTIYTRNIQARYHEIIKEVSNQNKVYRATHNRALRPHEMYQIYKTFGLDDSAKISVNRYFSKNRQLKSVNEKLDEMKVYLKALEDSKQKETVIVEEKPSQLGLF